MTDQNHYWSELLQKFQRKEFNNKEIRELENQMLASSVKLDQFLRANQQLLRRRHIFDEEHENMEDLWLTLQEKLPFLKGA
jgi:hypothetical protein